MATQDQRRRRPPPASRRPDANGHVPTRQWYPFGVQWTNNALFLCTLSCREYLTLGRVADPAVVPDVWDFADDLRAIARRRAAPQAG